MASDTGNFRRTIAKSVPAGPSFPSAPGGATLLRRMTRSEAISTILALSVGTVLLGVIFWRFETDPMWAIISFVLIYDADASAVRRAALARLGLTIFGSAVAMALIFLLGLHRWVLPAGLATAALICWVFFSARNSWRIVLVTVALILGSSLLQPSAGPSIAVTRSLEVSAGSLLAAALSLLVARIRR